jgi:hypothetical protein
MYVFSRAAGYQSCGWRRGEIHAHLLCIDLCMVGNMWPVTALRHAERPRHCCIARLVEDHATSSWLSPGTCASHRSRPFAARSWFCKEVFNSHIRSRVHGTTVLA